MTKILTFLGALLLSVAAHATDVRVLMVFTPGAQSYLQGMQMTANDPWTVSATELKEMTRIFQDSGIPANFVMAGVYQSPTCCGTGDLDQQRNIALTDGGVISARNAASADVVYVITQPNTSFARRPS